jgi:hypothetical protein
MKIGFRALGVFFGSSHSRTKSIVTSNFHPSRAVPFSYSALYNHNQAMSIPPNADFHTRSPHVLVIGSANQDLISYTNVIPQLGETVLGTSFDTCCGGKGANQAVAAASLELCPVTMVCKVGRDSFGSALLDNFRTFHFTSFITRVWIYN